MHIHHGLVFIATVLDLVSELRMFLRNPDLLLQPLFLVVQFTQTVLEHLSLTEHMGTN